MSIRFGVGDFIAAGELDAKILKRCTRKLSGLLEKEVDVRSTTEDVEVLFLGGLSTMIAESVQ